jgi:hypothetical protein
MSQIRAGNYPNVFKPHADRSNCTSYPDLVVTRTSRGHLDEGPGWLRLQDGAEVLTLPPRSITTLFPAGTAQGDGST